MHRPINVKSPDNTSKWQMEFNSAFKGLAEVDWFANAVRHTRRIMTYASAKSVSVAAAH